MTPFESIQGNRPIGARQTSAGNGCGTIYATRQALSQAPASPNGRAILGQNSPRWNDSRTLYNHYQNYMNIQINQEQLDAAVSQHINKAVAEALTGYKIKEAIAEKLSNDILNGAIAESLDKALEDFKSVELVKVLTVEMQKAVTAGVVISLREQTCEMVMRLRKVPEYDEAKRAASRAQIMAELNR